LLLSARSIPTVKRQEPLRGGSSGCIRVYQTVISGGIVTSSIRSIRKLLSPTNGKPYRVTHSLPFKPFRTLSKRFPSSLCTPRTQSSPTSTSRRTGVIQYFAPCVLDLNSAPELPTGYVCN